MHSYYKKIQVLNQIRTGTRVSEAARMYNVPYKTVWGWVNALNDPEVNKKRIKHNCYSIDEKVATLQLIESGKFTVLQIAALRNINQETIQRWIRDKDHIYALYSSKEQSPLNNTNPSCSGEEISAMSTSDDKDTRRHIRDLKEENEFLKAKVAYLEALMELNGVPVSGIKKKHDTMPLTKSSEEESGT